MFAKDKIIERIVRVDQAGEIGAQRIYNGQRFVFKLLNNKKEYEIFSEMAQEEKEHLDYFNNLAKQKNIKSSKLAPLFDIGAFAMGVGTALMGPKAAYVCTEAVEEVIEQHYNKQIDQLDKIDTEIQKKITKFRDDEAHHKETGNKNSDKSHPLLKKLINKTTEAAIFLAERT
jgi:ubiquinone biosynthesis monooxygenase Coq7|tara:strand:- start:124 stop:642 length:519 start_codon:yes stop_codon:yes gene_type:complete